MAAWQSTWRQAYMVFSCWHAQRRQKQGKIKEDVMIVSKWSWALTLSSARMQGSKGEIQECTEISWCCTGGRCTMGGSCVQPCPCAWVWPAPLRMLVRGNGCWVAQRGRNPPAVLGRGNPQPPTPLRGPQLGSGFWRHAAACQVQLPQQGQAGSQAQQPLPADARAVLQAAVWQTNNSGGTQAASAILVQDCPHHGATPPKGGVHSKHQQADSF